MKCKNWITAVLVAPMMLSMLMAWGGCFFDRHDDRDDRDRHENRHEHHDDHPDADIHVDIH